MINYENVNLNYILDTGEKLYYQVALLKDESFGRNFKHQYIQCMCDELKKTSGKLDFDKIENSFAKILSKLIDEKYQVKNEKPIPASFFVDVDKNNIAR